MKKSFSSVHYTKSHPERLNGLLKKLIEVVRLDSSRRIKVADFLYFCVKEYKNFGLGAFAKEYIGKKTGYFFVI